MGGKYRYSGRSSLFRVSVEVCCMTWELLAWALGECSGGLVGRKREGGWDGGVWYGSGWEILVGFLKEGAFGMVLERNETSETVLLTGYLTSGHHCPENSCYIDSLRICETKKPSAICLKRRCLHFVVNLAGNPPPEPSSICSWTPTYTWSGRKLVNDVTRISCL